MFKLKFLLFIGLRRQATREREFPEAKPRNQKPKRMAAHRPMLIEEVCWQRDWRLGQPRKLSRGWKRLNVELRLASDPSVIVAATRTDLEKLPPSSDEFGLLRVLANVQVFWVDPNWSKPSVLELLCRRTFECLAEERDRVGAAMTVRFDSLEAAERAVSSPCNAFRWLRKPATSKRKL